MLVVMVSMALTVISDGKASIAGSSIPSGRVSDSQASVGKIEEKDPPSCSATITITWTTAADD